MGDRGCGVVGEAGVRQVGVAEDAQGHEHQHRCGHCGGLAVSRRAGRAREVGGVEGAGWVGDVGAVAA
jgi:hypothetical protein